MAIKLRCPICTAELVKRLKSGQGTKECPKCSKVWYILYIKTNDKKEEIGNGQEEHRRINEGAV
jgi:Zn-finger nucleic acid-binding protein